MKRSEINGLILDAMACFKAYGWALPPEPRWDVTDFGLGDWRTHGLVLVNLSEQPEYCEKLMYAKHGMKTPLHTHKSKKEDIICRTGLLSVRVCPTQDDGPSTAKFVGVEVNGVPRDVASGSEVTLAAGERVTLKPGVWHEFWPESEECIIGEVSTANDDTHDNVFADPNIGRFPEIDEDEAAVVPLLSDPHV